MNSLEPASPREISELLVYAVSTAFVAKAHVLALREVITAAGITIDDEAYGKALDAAFVTEAERLSGQPDYMGTIVGAALAEARRRARK